jgi:hypothetical protein
MSEPFHPGDVIFRDNDPMFRLITEAYAYATGEVYGYIWEPLEASGYVFNSVGTYDPLLKEWSLVARGARRLWTSELERFRP